jgi:TRAP-type C4-dicarboxylate transport system permease small subunit
MKGLAQVFILLCGIGFTGLFVWYVIDLWKNRHNRDRFVEVGLAIFGILHVIGFGLMYLAFWAFNIN